MGLAELGLADVLEGAFKDQGHGRTFGRHPVSRWYAGFAVGLYCRGSGNPRASVRMKAAEGWDRVEVHRGRHAIARPDHRGEVRVQYDAGRVVCALGPPEA